MFLAVYLALSVLFKLYSRVRQFDGSLMTLGLMAQRLLSTIYGSMMMGMWNLTLNLILRLIFLLPFLLVPPLLSIFADEGASFELVVAGYSY
jgi:uncharacterized membrane protein YiaA